MLKEPSNEEYNAYVKTVTPKHNCTLNCLKAFLVGGVICTIGEAISRLLQTQAGLGMEDAGSYVSMLLVLTSVILTGFNLYGSLAKFGGAGALVPITGFANSVAAPCIEYQKEGQVFGIGCKIFTIAGPVILYGIFASWALGLICWVLQMFGIQL
jgi:stage V sporulation protein AC